MIGNWLGGCVLVLATALLVGCAEEPPPEKNVVRPVRAMKIADASQFKGRQFPGQARAGKEVELSYRVAGPLITLPVSIGDIVVKGDVIARIDPRDYEVQVQNVQAQLQQAQAVASRATADLERLDGVRAKNPGFVSQLDYDTAVQHKASALANVAALRASVDAAKDKVDYTSLAAPFDGIVVDTYVENFEDVRAQQPIVRIVDDSRIEFVVNIPENLISLVPAVKTVKVEFDALPGKPVEATVKEIGREASAATRTYPVTLTMAQPEDQKILPGMAGKAYGEPPEGMAPTGADVPVSAVFTGTEDEKSYVWVIDESAKTVSRREVSIGQLTDTGVRVSDGLAAGEWIATAGVHYLNEGQQVRILEQSAE